MVKNMQKTWYPWLDSVYKNIINNYKIKKLHHTILIESYNIHNTYKIIWAVSRWIFCNNKKNITNCGQCTGCTLIKNNNHPDLYILNPQNTRNTIDIDQIRKIIPMIQNTSQHNDIKIVWIPNYNTLTIFGINTLLKIIEEPPRNTFFLIGNVFNTVVHLTFKSRCLLYRIPTPNNKIGLLWIQKNTKIKKKMCSIALHISNNDPELAQQLLKKNWIKRNSLYKNIQLSINQNNFLPLLPILNTSSSLNKIYWLILLLFDSLKLKKQNIQDLINIDHIKLIQNISKKYSYTYLNNILNSWIICRYQLIHIEHIDYELLILQKLLKWQFLL